MAIQEVSKADTHSLRRFVTLERQLLEKYPMFVSNFDDEVVRHLSGQSPTGKIMQVAMFIASEGERMVARCAALINSHYQEAKNEKVGFIGYFAADSECEQSVTSMLENAENWLYRHGIRRVIAPFNGSALLGYGLLTDGFDEEPVITCGWNPPYYQAYLTNNGYRPSYPMLVYTYDFASPEYHAAKGRRTAQKEIRIRPMSKKHWEAELDIFRRVTNENFTHEWLWYPMAQEEFNDFFEIAKPMIDPQQMVIAEVEGKVAGIMIGFPNWNPMARKFHGKTGNWEKLKFLFQGSRYTTAGLIIGAVQSDFRGRGIGPAMELAV